MDYAAHRLACFDCYGARMCDWAAVLLDVRVAAVDEPYRRKREAVRKLNEALAQFPSGPEGRRYARQYIDHLMNHYGEEVPGEPEGRQGP